ncbi:Trimeric autotransporter adhesin YadA-like head domain-containing protein [Halomonas sp. NYA30]
MRFGFLNNFATQIAAPVADTDTSIELSAGADLIATALQDADAVVLTLFTTDDSGNEIKREVVYATATAAPLVTVTRAQEGSAAQAFSAGDGVEARLTAGVMGESYRMHIKGAGSASGDNSYALTADASAAMAHSFAVGRNARTLLVRSIAIGAGTLANGERAIAIGPATDETLPDTEAATNNQFGAYAYGNSAVAIGTGSKALNVSAVALGPYSKADNVSAVALGMGCSAYGYRSTAVNTNWDVYGEKSTAIGFWALVGSDELYADRAVAVGTSATIQAENGVAVGAHTYVNPTAPNGVAIGPGARVSVDSGFRINGVPYLSFAPDDNEIENTNSGLSSEVLATQLPLARRTASQVVFATDAIDLTSTAAATTLDLPANTILLPDSLDIVIMESASPSGAPEIQIGPSDATPAAYLSATPVGKTAVGGRETHAPLVTDGITALRVSVVTAGTGTLKAKIVVRGYVMEI